MSDYPQYRRVGDKFYNIIDEETMTEISCTHNEYDFVGDSKDVIEDVLFDEDVEILEDTDIDDLLEDVVNCFRVGGRPTPPPHKPPTEE